MVVSYYVYNSAGKLASWLNDVSKWAVS